MGFFKRKNIMNDKIYRGLDGVCIDTTVLSQVDGKNGKLIYLGYNIDELVQCNFEEITYLFLSKKLPNKKELTDFENRIKQERNIPDNILTYIKSTSPTSHPMATLRTCISMLSTLYKESMKDDIFFIMLYHLY